MKPQFIVTEVIFDADNWRTGKQFHITGLREATADKADQMGLAIIGHEWLEHVWMVRSVEDGREVYRARDETNNPTHVKVKYTRQAVSRKVRL